MAVTPDDVRSFANLSRIAVSDEEAQALAKELDAIFEYISVIQKVDVPPPGEENVHLDIDNVFREDEDPHEGGIYTDAFLKQAPETEGRFIKVKKILG